MYIYIYICFSNAREGRLLSLRINCTISRGDQGRETPRSSRKQKQQLTDQLKNVQLIKESMELNKVNKATQQPNDNYDQNLEHDIC